MPKNLHTGDERTANLLRIGREVAQHLTPVNDPLVVGRIMGLSPGLVHYYSMLALGKLVVRMKKAMKEEKWLRKWK